MSFQNPAGASWSGAHAATFHQGGQSRRVDFEPVSRVGGGLAFHTVIDFDNGAVLESAAMATVFRGYENLLLGRDARDAVFISSRACGLCGGAHASCSALALEMAFDAQPPAYGIAARNLLAATECLSDIPTHLFLRAGADYSEPVIRATNPELWTRAEAAIAPGGATHGFWHISDIMTALTSFSGSLWQEAAKQARLAREAYVLIGGKYPHPQTIVPAGISSTVDATDLNLVLLRVVRSLDYARTVITVWDDLVDFLLEAEPRFAEVGAGPANFIDLGLWDDPYTYDGTLENAPRWGERRWATPGAIVDGELKTTSLQALDVGVEEYVAHSFYEEWGGGEIYPTDPAGNPMTAHHPWNKKTVARPSAPDLQGRYSWSTAARWNGQAMETGAYARMWTTALARKVPHGDFLESTGRSLKMSIPMAQIPASQHEWHVPARWNALERNRARAYALGHALVVAYENVVIAYDLARKGGPDSKISAHYRIPKDHTVGVGYWGGGRGFVSHHVELDDRQIVNYQIVGPSTFNASPKDASGKPGPMEAAVLATPLISSERRDMCIDVLRAIRSFDPCLACAAH